MHSALIKINKAERSLTYRAEGHTGYAESGKDIVCAGVSLLAATLAQTVSIACKENRIGETSIVRISPDSTDVSCIAKDEASFKELSTAYSLIATGYSLLSESYPQFVSFQSEII